MKIAARVLVVERRHRTGVAVVAVERDTGDPSGRRGGQDLLRVVIDVADLVGRGRGDVVGVLLPVVVVGEDLGPQVRGLDHRAEILDDRGLLRRRHVGSRITGRGAVLRLVLHGDRVDVDSVGPVRLDELQQVQGVGLVDLGVAISRPPIRLPEVFIHAGGSTARR